MVHLIIFFRLLLLGCIIIIAGCQTGRRAQPHEMPSEALNAAIENASTDPLIEETSGLIPRQWWVLFHDEQLNQLIETAFSNNPTLQAALAHIQLAKTTADKVRASLYPNLLYGADVSREKLSETGIIPFNRNTSGTAAAASGDTAGAQPTTFGLPPGAGLVAPSPGGADGIPVYFTQYEMELTLTYEFDLWGKNRNLWRAAIGEMRALAADKAFVQLELGISVAQLYYRLQTSYKRREIIKALVENKKQYMSYIRERINGNLDNALRLQDKEDELLSAQLQLLQVEQTIAIDEYQLKAYLAGDFKEEIIPIHLDEQPLPRIPLPQDLPLHLLANRPDITAQLWLIESAGKQIEAAKAGFYPDFNLFALFGFQTITLDRLLNWKSVFFNVDPAVTLPIFDGGRLLSNLQGSEVNYDEAIYQYNQLILNATKEVLTTLSVLRNTEQQLQNFQAKQQRQAEILELTKLRITYHIDSGLDYLAAQENFLTAQNNLEMVVGETLQSMLLLIKALGGGYDSCDPEGM